MRYSLFSVRLPGLAVLVGLTAGQWSGVSIADGGLDVNFSARIVNNTCQIGLENGGNITLPAVMRSWFYNVDGSDRLQPTTDASGTPFSIRVEQCDTIGPGSGSLKALHFQFVPQSGVVSENKQVFINEAIQNAASNVGLVIFSEDYHTNVLNSDGSSDVKYDVSGKAAGSYLTDYTFYARYQNIGNVGSGAVLSSVIVNVTYE